MGAGRNIHGRISLRPDISGTKKTKGKKK